MAKMSKPQARKHCYSLVKNFSGSYESNEISCDIVVESNRKVMVLWNTPVRFHEIPFKESENYYTISVWWNEAESQTGDAINDDELPKEFDSRYITFTSFGDNDAIHFANSWKTMIRCCIIHHSDNSRDKALKVSEEYKTL